MFNKHLQSEKINNTAEEPAAPFSPLCYWGTGCMSPNKSHVLRAGQSQLSESSWQQCALLFPSRASQGPSASIVSPSWLPSWTSCPEPWFLSFAHRSHFTSWPGPPTSHAIEGQQLGTWDHPQLGLVSLVANGKTQASGQRRLDLSPSCQPMPACPLDRKTHAGRLPPGVSRREI